jgi:Zn finger protein HypA/HybF involved in hydrogenase expression
VTVMGGVTSFARTLDQELAALSRGASLECLVCGEFVQHVMGGILCPECGSRLGAAEADSGTSQVQLSLQAG